MVNKLLAEMQIQIYQTLQKCIALVLCIFSDKLLKSWYSNIFFFPSDLECQLQNFFIFPIQ